MCKQSVISRGHTVPADRVEDHGQSYVEERRESAEQRYCGYYDTDKGSKQDEQRDRALKSAQPRFGQGGDSGRIGLGPRGRGIYERRSDGRHEAAIRGRKSLERQAPTSELGVPDTPAAD